MCCYRKWRRERLSPSAYLPQGAWYATVNEEPVCGLDNDVCANPDGDEPWLCPHWQETDTPCPECAQEILDAAWLAEERETAGDLRNAAGSNLQNAAGSNRQNAAGSDCRIALDAVYSQRIAAAAGHSKLIASFARRLAKGMRWLWQSWPRLGQTPDGQLSCKRQTKADREETQAAWQEYQDWKNSSQNTQSRSRLLIVIPTDNESLA